MFHNCCIITWLHIQLIIYYSEYTNFGYSSDKIQAVITFTGLHIQFIYYSKYTIFGYSQDKIQSVVTFNWLHIKFIIYYSEYTTLFTHQTRSKW